MADKSLPLGGLPDEGSGSGSAAQPAADSLERRAFLRRAAMIGIPVVIASVPGRTVWAQPYRPAGGGGQTKPKKPGGAEEPMVDLSQTAGCLASAHPSGCANRVTVL